MIPSIPSTGQILFSCFHRISPWHLPFSNVICITDAAANFDTFEHASGVNSNIMINASNLFLYSYFLCVYFSISIICLYHPDKNSAYL